MKKAGPIKCFCGAGKLFSFPHHLLTGRGEAEAQTRAAGWTMLICHRGCQNLTRARSDPLAPGRIE